MLQPSLDGRESEDIMHWSRVMSGVKHYSVVREGCFISRSLPAAKAGADNRAMCRRNFVRCFSLETLIP